jgi:UDP-N-acetylmuramate--L-alanine ligase
MYPNEEITLLFQPHLFTRTRDFADGFAQSLAQFDRVVLLDIYPARELPIEGITSQWLLDKIDNPNKVLVTKDNIINHLQSHPSRVLVLAGAGDIGVEVEKIKKFLEKDI